MKSKYILLIGLVLIGLITGVYIKFISATEWNISTAVWDGPNSNFSVTTEDTYPLSIFFNPTGIKMYILGSAKKRVYQYTLSQAWNTSTAVWDGTSSNLNISSQDTNPFSVFFKSDGIKMYFVGYSNKTVYQYTLSQAWNPSTASYDNVNFSVTQDTGPIGISFNPSGTKMYVVGNIKDRIFQYTLPSAGGGIPSSKVSLLGTNNHIKISGGSRFILSG